MLSDLHTNHSRRQWRAVRRGMSAVQTGVVLALIGMGVVSSVSLLGNSSRNELEQTANVFGDPTALVGAGAGYGGSGGSGSSDGSGDTSGGTGSGTGYGGGSEDAGGSDTGGNGGSGDSGGTGGGLCP